MADAKLEILVTLKDKASRGITGLRGKMAGLGKMAGKIMRAGVLAGGVAIAAIGAAAIKFGTDFKNAENIIRAGTGATGKALEGLYEDFKATFAEVPADMEAVATATADLNTRLGLTGKPLQALSAQFLELSRITKTDVATNIRLGTRVLGDWGIATEDSSRTMDFLFKVSQTTGISLDKLQTSIVAYGAPMRQFGFTFEKAALLMGKWEKEGVNTEAIMSGLKIGVANLAKAGIPLEQGLADIIAELTELGPGAAATSRAIEVFGSRAGPDMAAAITEGRFALDDLTATVRNSDETIMKVAEDTRTWQDKLKMLRNRVLVKLEPLMSKVVDALGDFATILMDDVIPAIEEWWQKQGPAIMRTLREVGGYLRDFFAPALDTLADLWNNLKGPLRTVGQFLMEHKPLLIAVAVAILLLVAPWLAVVAAIAVVLAKWDEISQFFTKTVPDAIDDVIAKIEELPVIGEVFKAVQQVVKDKIEAVISTLQGLVDFAKELIRFFKAVFSGDWAAAWESLKEMAKITLGLFLDWLELTFVGTIRSLLGALGLWDAAKGAFETFKTKASSFLNGVVDTVRGIGSDIAKGLGDGLRAAKGFVSGALNALITVVEKGANFLIRGINNLMAPLRGLAGALGAALSFFGAPRIPTIPPIPTISIPRLYKGGEVIKTGIAEVHEGERFSRGGATVHVHIERVGVGVTEAEIRDLAIRVHAAFEQELA